jgi:hypothetical protein
MIEKAGADFAKDHLEIVIRSTPDLAPADRSYSPQAAKAC